METRVQQANKFGDCGGALGKCFGRLQIAAGYGKQHLFHSIGKTVATFLENAKVLEGAAADIVGQDKPTMTYGLHNGGASMKTKRGAIEKAALPSSRVSYSELRHPLEGHSMDAYDGHLAQDGGSPNDDTDARRLLRDVLCWHRRASWRSSTQQRSPSWWERGRRVSQARLPEMNIEIIGKRT